MTKKIGLSLAAASLLAATNVSAASNLSEAFTNATMKGKVQAFYQTREAVGGDTDVSLMDQAGSDATAGMTIGLVTEELNGAQIGMTYVFLNTLGLENDSVSGVVNTPAGRNNNEYANTLNGGYFSEMYFQKAMANTILKAGYQELHTPLANSDMWAVAPNTFNAAVLINKDVKDLTIIAANVTEEKTRMSAQFDTFGIRGANAVGLVHNMGLSFWHYDVVNAGTANYIEYKGAAGDISYAAQYGAITPDTDTFDGGTATSALGLKGAYKMGDTTLTLAYSSVMSDEDAVFNFSNFGDGGTKTPLYTMNTIAGDGDIVGATDTTAIAFTAAQKLGKHTASFHFNTAQHGDNSSAYVPDAVAVAGSAATLNTAGYLDPVTGEYVAPVYNDDAVAASAATEEATTSTTMELRFVSNWTEQMKTFLAYGSYNHTVGFFKGEADSANSFLRVWGKYSF